MAEATPIERAIATDRAAVMHSTQAKAASGSSGVARRAQLELRRLRHEQLADEVQGRGH